MKKKLLFVFVVLSFLLAGCVGGNGGTDTRYNVSGRVVDSNGHGIPGARIVYEGVESSGTEESGSDGSFQLTGLAGKVEITAVKDGWVFVPDVVTKARDNVLVRGSRQTVDLSVHVIEFGPTKICEVTVREVKGLPGAVKFTLLNQEIPAANVGESLTVSTVGDTIDLYLLAENGSVVKQMSLSPTQFQGEIPLLESASFAEQGLQGSGGVYAMGGSSPGLLAYATLQLENYAGDKDFFLANTRDLPADLFIINTIGVEFDHAFADPDQFNDLLMGEITSNGYRLDGLGLYLRGANKQRLFDVKMKTEVSLAQEQKVLSGLAKLYDLANPQGKELQDEAAATVPVGIEIETISFSGSKVFRIAVTSAESLSSANGFSINGEKIAPIGESIDYVTEADEVEVHILEAAGRGFHYGLTISADGFGEVRQSLIDGYEESKTDSTTYYEPLSEISLEAVPDDGWSFSHWEGDVTGGSPFVTLTMVEHKHVKAVFVPQEISVQQLIDNAKDGEVVVIPPGRYHENIQIRGKSITLRSGDPSDPDIVAETIIYGKGDKAVITIQDGADVTISGLTITNGRGHFAGGVRRGGGIYVRNSALDISYSVIKGNLAKEGGGSGVYLQGGSSKISNSLFLDNGDRDSGSGGGIYIHSGQHEVVSNEFRGNQAFYQGSRGGAIYIAGQVTAVVEGNIIRENDAALGGGIAVDGGTHPLHVEIIGNYVEDNSAWWSGGGIMATCGDDSTIVIARNEIRRNELTGTWGDEAGGGIRLGNYGHKPSFFILEDNRITDNYSPIYGGGIHVEYGVDVLLRDNEISRNRAAFGGGVYMAGNGAIARYSALTAYDNRFEHNEAAHDGGVVYIASGSGLFDKDGTALSGLDSSNILTGNKPNDVYWE